MATLSVGGQLVATNDTLSNGVQDNITRLGTVTSGVIGSAVTGTIGTGVTFPAGHIIQVVTNTHATDSASTGSLTPVRLTDGHDATITNVVSGNDVLIIMTCTVRLDTSTNQNSVGTGVNLYRESTEIRKTEGHMWYHNNAHVTGAKTYVDIISFHHLDTSPAVGSNKYHIGHEVYSTTAPGLIASSTAPFSMTLMEIQR